MCTYCIYAHFKVYAYFQLHTYVCNSMLRTFVSHNLCSVLYAATYVAISVMSLLYSVLLIIILTRRGRSPWHQEFQKSLIAWGHLINLLIQLGMCIILHRYITVWVLGLEQRLRIDLWAFVNNIRWRFKPLGIIKVFRHLILFTVY